MNLDPILAGERDEQVHLGQKLLLMAKQAPKVATSEVLSYVSSDISRYVAILGF